MRQWWERQRRARARARKEIVEQSLHHQQTERPGNWGRGFKTDTAILPRASLGLHDKNRDDEPKPVDSESLALGLGGMVRGQGQRSAGAMEGFSLLVRPEKCLGRPQR